MTPKATAKSIGDTHGTEEAVPGGEGGGAGVPRGFWGPFRRSLEVYLRHPTYWIALAAFGGLMSLHPGLLLVGVLAGPALWILSVGGAQLALEGDEPLSLGAVWSRYGDRLGPTFVVALVVPALGTFAFLAAYVALFALGAGAALVLRDSLLAPFVLGGYAILSIALLVILGHRAFCAWLFAEQVVILEGIPAWQALARSYRLFQGNYWGLTGFLLVLTLLGGGTSHLGQFAMGRGYRLLFGAGFPGPGSSGVLGQGLLPAAYIWVTCTASAVVAAWWSTAWTYRYLQERERS